MLDEEEKMKQNNATDKPRLARSNHWVPAPRVYRPAHLHRKKPPPRVVSDGRAFNRPFTSIPANSTVQPYATRKLDTATQCAPRHTSPSGKRVAELRIQPSNSILNRQTYHRPKHSLRTRTCVKKAHPRPGQSVTRRPDKANSTLNFVRPV